QDEILRITDTTRQQQTLLDRYMEAHQDEYPKPPPWERVIRFGPGGGGPRGFGVRGGRGRGGPEIPGSRGPFFPQGGQGRGWGNQRAPEQGDAPCRRIPRRPLGVTSNRPLAESGSACNGRRRATAALRDRARFGRS